VITRGSEANRVIAVEQAAQLLPSGNAVVLREGSTYPVPQGLRQADCETPGNLLVTHSARALALWGQWECAVWGEAPPCIAGVF
jgi:hypothetical protein